jgi:hypothetical protein
MWAAMFAMKAEATPAAILGAARVASTAPSAPAVAAKTPTKA